MLEKNKEIIGFEQKQEELNIEVLSQQCSPYTIEKIKGKEPVSSKKQNNLQNAIMNVEEHMPDKLDLKVEEPQKFRWITVGHGVV